MDTKKILVSGFINTNVLDGSAIFMSSLTQVLAKHPQAQVDVLLAVPNERDIVLDDIEGLSNVNIIDPFADKRFGKFDYLKNNKLTKKQYSELISATDAMENYDAIFIRSLEVVEALIELDAQLTSKIYAYITGVTSFHQQLDENLVNLLKNITTNNGYLLCQTHEMKEHILKQTDIARERIIDLNPMIPNQQNEFDEIFMKKDKYQTFCYTGKFAYEWNIIEMITQFRELAEKYPEAKLFIAGDQFKKTDKDEKFIPYAKYLIENSKNVYWVGGLARQDTLNLISESDVGLTYRHEDLSDSLELSTKLLEYCSLGVPPVLNRTAMHERIFGADYPYFANSDEEFYNVLEKVILNPEEYEQTALKVFEIASHYSFNATFERLLPYLPFEQVEEFDLLNKSTVFNSTYIDNEQNKAVILINYNYIAELKNIVEEYRIQGVKVIDEKAILNLSEGNNSNQELLEVIQTIELMRPKAKQVAKSNFSISNIQKQYNKVDVNVDKLVKENQRLRRDLKRVREKYNNLSNSKLGSIQKRYWKYKNKN